MSTERKVIELPDRTQEMQSVVNPFDLAMGLKVWEQRQASAITSRWSRSELTATSLIREWASRRMVRKAA